MELVRQWSWLKRHGALPYAGGVEDQSPRFLFAVETLDSTQWKE